MVFKAVSEKIDFDAVKESTTLTGEALAEKQARDKELEAIIKGEDDRTLLVIGHVHLIMRMQFLIMLTVWLNFKKKLKIKSLWLCVSIQLNLVQMVMAIKDLYTNLMLKGNQT